VVTVFANNQLIVTDGTVNGVIDTDPMPMGGNDRVASVLNMHYIYGSGATLSVQFMGSNDGQNWVNIGSPETKTTPPTKSQLPEQTAVFAFVKYEFTLTAAGAAAVCFDLHSVIDHS